MYRGSLVKLSSEFTTQHKHSRMLAGGTTGELYHIEHYVNDNMNARPATVYLEYCTALACIVLIRDKLELTKN